MKLTTDGTSGSPASSGMTSGPPSGVIQATTEYVVPRSMPTAGAIVPR